MNGYLVPANAKRGTLIFNIFTWFDVILFGTGLGITILSLLFIDTTNVYLTLFVCMPALITGFLVLPIPNYHNVLGFLESFIKFYNNRRKFIWRGWCFSEYFSDERQRSK